ncbi:MAG TPA: ATP-dependent Clp protease proteolytic subunit, partial [Thermoguttaceae bacterium]|nr:ATP-dependent Clp protease proteolytic subunit [Thermoguttaceae bacterium]
IMIHAKEFKALKDRLNQILLKHTGHPLEKIEKDTDRDRFMSAEEAKEYGLIDRVLERLSDVSSSASAASSPREESSSEGK